MEAIHSAFFTPENTDHRSRDRNVATVFVPSDWFTRLRDAGVIDLVDESHEYVHSARRLVLTQWLFAQVATVEDDEAVRASSALWRAHSSSLHEMRRATVTTVLFKLHSLGLVEALSEAAGGFMVTIREAQAA
jgi:hypothetical protein